VPNGKLEKTPKRGRERRGKDKIRKKIIEETADNRETRRCAAERNLPRIHIVPTSVRINDFPYHFFTNESWYYCYMRHIDTHGIGAAEALRKTRMKRT
jgi:hypothetical protein